MCLHMLIRRFMGSGESNLVFLEWVAQRHRHFWCVCLCRELTLNPSQLSCYNYTSFYNLFLLECFEIEELRKQFLPEEDREDEVKPNEI